MRFVTDAGTEPRLIAASLPRGVVFSRYPDGVLMMTCDEDRLVYMAGEDVGILSGRGFKTTEVLEVYGPLRVES